MCQPQPLPHALPSCQCQEGLAHARAARGELAKSTAHATHAPPPPPLPRTTTPSHQPSPSPPSLPAPPHLACACPSPSLCSPIIPGPMGGLHMQGQQGGSWPPAPHPTTTTPSPHHQPSTYSPPPSPPTPPHPTLHVPAPATRSHVLSHYSHDAKATGALRMQGETRGRGAGHIQAPHTDALDVQHTRPGVVGGEREQEV